MSKKSKKDMIYEQLKNEIILGVMKPKDRIIELGIAEKFGSSQAPIREALLKLQEDGLVDMIPYTGSFVSDVNFQEIKELFEYRRSIELNALKAVIHLLTKDDIEGLEKLLAEMKEAGKKKNLAALISCDMNFHRKIIEKTRKTISLSIWLKLDLHIRRFIAAVHPTYYANLEEIADEHYPLLVALKERDLAAAQKAFNVHFNIDPILKKLNI
ncbi:GntR family transcriptional regulator [Bacillus sp. Marseille-P3661]|uniref:GntR family transcriptional regulator n=1 Tax=Bacillus sp. Marseille-P3661 TaxID=1936234 RepID=UPI000C8204C5|nr:GntR family transcriptional regulator [Bacillus sp. Marseille-P3661]